MRSSRHRIPARQHCPRRPPWWRARPGPRTAILACRTSLRLICGRRGLAARARRSITSHHELDPRPRRQPRTPARGTRAHARGDRQRPDRRAGADDLWLPGGRREPGVRAATGPRAAREGGAAPRGRSRPHSRAWTQACTASAPRAANASRPSDWMRSRGPPCASMPAPGRPAPMTATRRDGRGARRNRGDPSRRPDAARYRAAHAAARLRAARTSALPQGRVPPADRRLQDPRRLRRGRLARRCRTCARRHHVLVGEPRAGRRARGSTARRAGRGGHPSDAPAIKRDRVAADGAEIVVVGTASEERRRSPSASPWSAACRSSRPMTTIGSSRARGPSAWS